MAIELIATFISICKSAIMAGRGLKSLADEQMTEREKEVLSEGAANGMFQITKIECVPHLYCNSTGRMFAGDDPAITAHYLEAFRKHCHRGYVVPCDGELFQLSGTGFDAARELAAKIGA